MMIISEHRSSPVLLVEIIYGIRCGARLLLDKMRKISRFNFVSTQFIRPSRVCLISKVISIWKRWKIKKCPGLFRVSVADVLILDWCCEFGWPGLFCWHRTINKSETALTRRHLAIISLTREVFQTIKFVKVLEILSGKYGMNNSYLINWVARRPIFRNQVCLHEVITKRILKFTTSSFYCFVLIFWWSLCIFCSTFLTEWITRVPSFVLLSELASPSERENCFQKFLVDQKNIKMRKSDSCLSRVRGVCDKQQQFSWNLWFWLKNPGQIQI